MNFESCIWSAVSSHSSHHPQEVILAQFSLIAYKGGLDPNSFINLYIQYHSYMYTYLYTPYSAKGDVRPCTANWSDNSCR